MPTSYAKLWITGTATLVMLAGITLAGEGWKKGDSLPNLKTAGVEGSLPNLKGKVVLVDFWASWCAPCKQSFPVLDKLQADYRTKGVIVLGINVDDDKGAMTKFLEEHSVSFPIVHDAKHKLVEAAGVEAMPTSFLVDQKGVIRVVHNGFHAKKTEAELTKEIDDLLKEGAVEVNK